MAANDNPEEWDEERAELDEEQSDIVNVFQYGVKQTDFTEDKPGTKVTLVAEQNEIIVIKEVLSYHSNYFNTLLGSPNFIESGSDKIKIDYAFDELQMCMEIAHGAATYPNNRLHPSMTRCEMGLCRLQRLIIAGDRFDLPVVRRYCEAELIEKHNEEEVVRAYLLAKQYGFEEVEYNLSKKLTEGAARHWLNRERIKRVEKYGPNLEVAIPNETLRTLFDLATKPAA